METRPVRYLTVQDVLWLHLQLTGRPPRFRYAALEEATYQQYGYGSSLDVPAQAQRVLAAFVKHRPFDQSNVASGLVVALAFLAMNGYDITLDDAGLKRFMTAVEGASTVPDLMPYVVPARERHHVEAETRAVVESVLARYPETTASLAARVAA